MQKRILSAAIVLAGLAIPCAVGYALVIAVPQGPERYVNADAVFVGRVTAIKPVDIEAQSFPGAKTTQKFTIAIVQINEAIRGIKTEKMIEVGFVPIVQPKPGVPQIGGGRRSPQLEVGQEGLYALNKHHEGKFYLAPNFGNYIPAADKANLEKEVKIAKQVVAVMANPKAALESKDAEARLMAASIQINRYRMQKAPFPNREEPISAEETKLLFDALLADKWQPGRFGQPNAFQLFNQIGLNAKDGWTQPRNIKNIDEVRQAAQNWLREHPEYRIKRFVSKAETK
jgi:hypothetical protein